MGNTITTAVCPDYTLSMAPSFDRIKEKIRNVLDTVLVDDYDGARLGLVEFRSHRDQPVTIVNEFTRNRNTFEQLLVAHQPQGDCGDQGKAIGEALKEVLNLEWHDNNAKEQCPEKLAILITNDAPNGLFGPLNGTDPWIISSQLREKDITLVVIGVGDNIVTCDDFYCALAQNTGGVYIPWINAERILSSVIQWVTREKLTFRQAFHRVSIADIEKNSSFKYSYMKERVDGMINECATMNDIRRLFYQHRFNLCDDY